MRNARQFNRHDRLSAGHALLLLLSLVGSALLIGLSARTGRYPYVACVGLVPLFVAIRICRPLGAFLSGALWGLSLWTVSFAGLGPAITLSTTPFFVMIVSPALYAWLGALMTRWIGFSPLILGVGWIPFELAFARVGFAHGLIFAAATANDTVINLAHILGSAVVTFAAALCNLTLVSVIERAVHFGTQLRPIVRARLRVVCGAWFALLKANTSAMGPLHARAPPRCLAMH